MRHRLFSRAHEIELTLDYRNCKKHDEVDNSQAPTEDTAKQHLPLRRPQSVPHYLTTTRSLRNISTPSAASVT